MSQQLKISSIFSVAALAALCISTQDAEYALSNQALGIALSAPAPIASAQIN